MQKIIDISTPDDGLGDVLRTGFDKTNQNFTELYNGKVDKITGKGLSENDFTDSDKSKLTGIEAGAQVNVNSDWGELDPSASGYILNKPPSMHASVGHFHFSDLATQTSPLVVLPDVPKKLTNDALGAYTELDYAPFGIATSFWNTTNNQFDFSSLSLGDSLLVRTDLHIVTTSANQTFTIYLKLGIGTASEYNLLIDSFNVKTIITDLHIIKDVSFSIDNDDWKNAPAEVYILSDDDATVKVNGWYVPIVRRDVNVVNILTDPLKLDKVTSSGVERAYIINADGSQSTKPTSEFGGALSGSASYIQNQNDSAQSANMWISGDVKARAATFSSKVSTVGVTSVIESNGGFNAVSSNVNDDNVSFKIMNSAASKVYAFTAGKQGVTHDGFGLWNVTDNTHPVWVEPSGDVSLNSNTTVSGTVTAGRFSVEDWFAQTTLTGSNITIKKIDWSAYGGWARNLLDYKEFNDTTYLQIGSYGNKNTLEYNYIGQAYDNTAIRWYLDKRVILEGNVGIGSINTPGARLDVRAQGALATDIVLRVRNLTDTQNFLVVNGAGDVYNNGAGGVNTNTFFGENVGRNTTGGYNTAIGNYALSNNTTGVYNTAIGVNALLANTTGVYNTAIGVNALLANTTGNSNAAIGTYALLANTTGSNNAAIGQNALRTNTTGSNNAAIGIGALGSNTTGNSNAAIGVSALGNNTTGNSNAAIGTYALLANTTGSNNAAIGLSAGRLISNGSNNTITNNSIFIGFDTRALADDQTNQIVIGHNAIGQGSNSVVLGNTSITITQLRGQVIMGAFNSAPTGIEGAIYYDSTTKKHRGFNGTAWNDLY